MQDRYKYRNYMKIENADRSYTYFVIVDGKDIEVSAAVYKEYIQGCHKMEHMERGMKRDRVLRDETGAIVRDENGRPIILPEREVSLDKLIAEDWEFLSPALSPEEIVMKQLEIEVLHRCLDLLDSDERKLINALFFDGMSEREYSSKTGMPQKTINYRKHRVLRKLKNLFEEN